MDARQRAYGFACARAASHPGHALSSDALVSPIHFSNSPSRSRGAFFAPEFCFVASLHPDRRVAERRETYGCSDTRGPARDAAGQALARRLASHNAGRPPPGALTVAILGSGPALPSPAFAPDRSQRAPRVRVVVPGWRGPVPPGAVVMSRCRRTPRLAPPSGSPLESAPQSAKLGTYVEQTASRRQHKNAICIGKFLCSHIGAHVVAGPASHCYG